VLLLGQRARDRNHYQRPLLVALERNTMSLMRKRRLERLERRRPRGKPLVDRSPWCVPIFEAMLDGRPFEWLPFDRELSGAQAEGLVRRMRELDTIAKRLEDGDPGSTTRAQADRERRQKAMLAAIEREGERREGRTASEPEGPIGS
jgi:hypothetical protein